MARKQSFSDSLRAAIANAPESRYRISKITGISEPTLSRFMHGSAGLTIPNLDILFEHLGLRIVGPDRQKKG